MGNYLVLLVVCGGCVFGIGPVAGYGKKKGFYGGISGYAGANIPQLTVELGRNGGGGMVQIRADAEVSKVRTTGYPFDSPEEDKVYPGFRAGIGFSRAAGVTDVAAIVGPDIGIETSETTCGSRGFFVSVEWRYVGGEQQVVVAPRYETIGDLCFR